MAQQPTPPDVDQVIRRSRIALVKHLSVRLAVGIALVAVPFVLRLAGAPVSLFTVLPVVPGLFVLLFLYLRIPLGRRLKVSEKVLRTYPLEYRTRLVRKRSQRQLLGNVHTIKLSVRGQHGARIMRAVHTSSTRRWPEGAEGNGAWFAGDPAYGGVLIVPSTGDMFLLQPAPWEQLAGERAEASQDRREKAEGAGISQRLEKESNRMAGLGN
ncbi:hypothetical protein [Streptomyces alfalfae]|uniref:hypothetical protein n=1 Tax=Streptomyces alfalfae TaxID=1642299 RepID=UPI0028120E0B|nr:hypothetical protein [Streptomyces alfalfae]